MNKKIIIAGILAAAVSSAAVVAPGTELDPGFSQPPLRATATAAASGDLIPENAPEIHAKAGLLLEANSGEVLLSQNADARLPIASMTKIATLGVVYDALNQGELTFDDQITVSANAASMGGSQAFLDSGSQYSVRDLVQSIVVASANDSCVALAEAIAGTVGDFVERMNTWAENAGATNTHFVNCTGLPTPGAYSCARDLGQMYRALMRYPHYGDFNQVWLYDLTHPSGRVTGLTNTNRLVRTYPGCLGGKTGFTNEAGHCITVAAERDALRPIAVIIGAPDSKTRFQDARALLDFAVNGYENALVVDQTQPVATVPVRGAVAATVDLYPTQNCYQLTKKGDPGELAVATDLPESVNAPLAAGESVGTIYVTRAGKVVATVPVSVPRTIPAAGYWANVQKIIGQQGFNQ